MKRIPLPALAVLAALLPGCATISGTATQPIEVRAVDGQDRPVRGMECRIANGISEQIVKLPVAEVSVRRSSADLEIECRRGELLARGTAVPRGDAKMENSFMPGSSIAALVDHLSGYMYSYPTPLRLRVGEHLRFEFSDAPRAELVASRAPPASSVPQPTVTALPVVATPVIAAPAHADAPAPRTAVRPSVAPRPVAKAAPPELPPAVKHESLDPRDLRLRAGAQASVP
jgi:hypothetical protein